MIRVICVCGARPNFMKIAPVIRSLRKSGQFDPLLVHTGQHYDREMSQLFFEQLGIPEPDINLEVGSASHAVQTANIMVAFEPIVCQNRPDYVLVVGDVNSTIACGLVATKLGVPLIHVEAGLRSFDMSMPEEINRILTDRISDLLFVTEQSGVDNLLREGAEESRIHMVGNVMIDTLLANREKAEGSTILDTLGITDRQYGVITLHRPSNVDSPERFGEILSAFEVIEQDMPLVFPIHPRTLNNLEQMKLKERIQAMRNLHLVEPLGYLDFLCLLSKSAFVMTDSGGIQEETTVLQVPCLTLRENTERPVTITEGTNRLVKPDCDAILQHFKELQSSQFKTSGRLPQLWDGMAADRIVEILSRIG